MKYSLGEISEILGIAKTTIRNYESHGLLNLSREDNNYRVFTEEDLFTLREVHHLRQLGFSVDEIKEIITGTDKDTLREMYRVKRVTLEEEVQRKITAIRNLEISERNIELLDEMNIVREDTLADILWLENNDDHMGLQTIMAKLMPDSFISFRYNQTNMRSGIGIEKEKFLKRYYAIPEEIEVLKGGKSLRVTVAHSDPIEAFHIAGDLLAQYGDEHHLALDDEYLMQGITTLKSNGDIREYYSIIWRLIK